MNQTTLRPITEDERRHFEEDGVVCLRGVIDADWVRRMQQAVDYVLSHPGRHAADLTAEGTSGRFAFDNYLWTFNDDFRAMAFESPVASIAAQIMGSQNINLIFDFILVKEPNTPTPTRWHQDLPANPVEGQHVCGVWFSLDYVTHESGAVEWIKGSHKWPDRFEAIVNGDPKKHPYLRGFDVTAPAGASMDPTEPMPDIDLNRAKYDIVSFDTEPGDMIFSSLLMTHGAPGNLTDRRRRAFGYRFAGDDSSYAVRTSSRAIKPIRDPNLNHGDSFPDDPNHPVFPRVWPRLI
jgi:ectoine hydroxylase-related dioxygenase (phytanoyl-CoA dioxygenase family)